MLFAAAVLFSGCTAVLDGNPLGSADDPSGSDGGNGPGGSGADDPGNGGDDDPTKKPTEGAGLPCDVENLLSTYCTGCHNGSPAGLAPMPLLTRSDLLAAAPTRSDLSVGELSILRMRSDDRPMPPGANLPEDMLTKFDAWVKDGMPAEVCMDEGSIPPLPFDAASAASATAQVKGLLTGLAPSEAELNAVTADPNALKGLIDGWMALPEFDQKLQAFFVKAFQQSGFTSESLIEQLGERLEGPKTSSVPLLQNLEQSFALTALDLTKRGQPFTETATTQTYMMTTALMSFFGALEARHVDDARKKTDTQIPIQVVRNVTPIPFADSVNPQSANYMRFFISDLVRTQCKTNTFSFRASIDMFHILMGRLRGGGANRECFTDFKPLLQPSHFNDWRPVTIRKPVGNEKTSDFWNLPALENADELVLKTPRVGFFTTPAFFANWATNDSNQMRVTANQTLIVALGASFDGSDNTVPVTDNGLAAEHAGPTTACYGCHKTLDPMRQFFRQSFTLAYHDQRDTTQTTLNGAFLFEGATDQGKGMSTLAQALVDHDRFSAAWAQKLCYYATSAPCGTDDPEFVRVAKTFRDSNYDFKTLVRELFSSPLITAMANTQTFDTRAPVVGISRQDHLCHALSARLSVPDVCGFGGQQDTMRKATRLIASAIPADSFSRGSEIPVVLSDTNLFFRSATEGLCMAVAAGVVDGPVATNKYQSTAADAAIVDMVHNLMALAASDPREPEALTILREHYQAALDAGNSAKDALRSTFVLSCTAPSTVTTGL